MLSALVGTLLFAVLAPVAGCLLAGLDRKVSARMQGRVGPPLLQPYYDVRKLLAKDDVAPNGSQGAYVWSALIFAIIAGGVFFSGGDILLCAFIVTLASFLFVAAAYSARSPFSDAAAAREAVQVMAYEPMVLLMAVAFFALTGTFSVSGVVGASAPMVVCGWPTLLGLVFILTIKLRKSPFDLSMSSHAHQELVSGMTTDMSGPTLARVEILHWCESVLFLGWVGMFFVWNSPVSWLVAIVVCVLVYLFEIWLDNNCARVKWQAMLASAWSVALVCGGANVAILALV